ncbi:MAG: aminotransferase class V-fold PLP-dependent enzyme, partial [Lachnospiraceae bacterium]|nr:aminotransferase class V-fold PLP-dependent enzyme [Lachnospiraceae bacterium]
LATKLIYDGLEADTAKMYEQKQYFINELLKLPGVSINGIPEIDSEDMCAAVKESAPHIVSASFEGVRAEVLLHALEAKGIYVSAGSACASNKPAKSATLSAIRLPASLLDSTLRFSLSVMTKKEEIDHTLEVLAEELPALRRYRRS